MPIRRVAVIGAGLAGLTAAWRLVRAGLDVQVFERESQAGGRAASIDVLGLRIDPAGQVFRAGDSSLRQLLGELGIADSVTPLPEASIAQAGDDRVAPVDASSFAGIARIPGIGRVAAGRVPRLGRITERFGALLDSAVPERAARLDDRSAADFGRLYFGERALARWIEPQLAHATGLAAEQTSRVTFLLRAAPGPGATLVTLPGGLGDLVERLSREISTHLGVSVHGIEPNGTGIRLGLRDGRSDRSEDVDAVVVATAAAETLHIAAPLLVAAERDVLDVARVEPAVALTIGLRAMPRPLLRRLIVPAALRSPLRSIAFRETPRDPSGAGAIAVLLSTASYARREIDAASESIEKSLLAAAERWCPDLASELVFTHLARWHAAIPCFPPGRLREIARLRTALRDRRAQGRSLYLAGDHLVSPSADGAIASGLRAASALLADANAR